MVRTFSRKQAIDYIKRTSGNTDDYIMEFDDYVKEIKYGLTTSLKVFSKLLDKHEVFFKMAYNEGKKEIATLIFKLEKDFIFIENDYISRIKNLEDENERLHREISEIYNMYKTLKDKEETK